MNNNIKENHDRSMIDEQRPYAGLQFFREEDKEYFFGREREIKELTELIDQDILTIVFGKSGMGKTSLLRAGLLPGLRRELYIPVYLRINFNDPKHPPINQVKETVEAKIKEIFPDISSIEDKTLWEYFSYTDMLAGFVKPLLVFDQFEEVFQAQKENSAIVYTFLKEIADLIENRVPYEVLERLKKEQKILSYAKQERDIRIIFSLREDYLPQLETLSKNIPSINGTGRFRVSCMKGEDAIDAVLKPAKGLIKDPDVATKIINKIPGPKGVYYKPFETIDESWKTKEIEPFLLSLFCYQVNERRIEKGANEISGELIGDVNTEDIINEFYNDNIRGFKPHVKVAIEDHLLTPLGYRKLEEKDSLIERGKVTDREIRELVNKRLIRREEHRGVEYVELIHDVLAPILKANRDKRKEAQKRKRNRFIISIVLFILIAGSIGGYFYQDAKIKKEQQIAKAEKQRAEEQKQRADKEERQKKVNERAAYSLKWLPENPRLSFCLAEAAYEIDKEKENVIYHLSLLNLFYGQEGFYKVFLENQGKWFSQISSKYPEGCFAIYHPKKEKILTLNDNRAILWNLDREKISMLESPILSNEMKFKYMAAFSRQGEVVALAAESNSSDEDMVILWEFPQSDFKRFPIGSYINSINFSSKYIAVADSDENILLLDLAGSVVDKLRAHENYISSIAAYTDLRKDLIVSASLDKTVKLWDLNNEIKKPKIFRNEDNEDAEGFNSADFSPDGEIVLIGGGDGNLILWNYVENESKPLQKDSSELNSAVFFPDGRYIVTVRANKTIHLLAKNSFLVFEIKDIEDNIQAISISPDGRYILITVTNNPPQLRPIAPKEIIRIIRTIKESDKTYNLTDRERATYGIPKLPKQEEDR